MKASRAWWASLVAFVLGLASGVVHDERPPRPVVHRAGYRVLEGDFHVHTTYSDGVLSPLLVVRQAERRGLDVVAVTEHNTTLPGRVARAWAQTTDGPLVIVGEEVTTRRHHLIALGIERTISADLPIGAVVDDIHAQGGLAVAAHPVVRFQAGLAPIRERLDGAEVMHPIAWTSRDETWRWRDIVDYWEATSPRPAAIGSSDYHFASVLGLCRTLVFVREPADDRAVLEALRAKRTVVIDREGIPHGDPQMIAALAAEPHEPRTSDYAYRGANIIDRVLRLLGLAGVAGLVFFRRASRHGNGDTTHA